MSLNEDKSTSKIRYQRMSELVFERLMDWIMDGTVSMGEKLNAEELANRMGVSRMPVREALKNMERSGIVESIPYAGARVVELTMEDVIQIYIMRQALEPLAVYYACKNITDEEIDVIERIQERLEDVLRQSKPDAKKIFMINREFHFTIFNISNMRHLVSTIETLWDRLAFFKLIYGRKYVRGRESAEEKIREHRAYIEMLKKRDAESLKEATHNTLKKHISNLKNKVTDYIYVN